MIEAREWEVVPLLKKEIERYRSYAKYTLDKTRNINIRLSQQTLAASILHKYAMRA